MNTFPFDLSYLKKKYKTGVMNDPLGQPTVSVCNDISLILTFWEGRTDSLCKNSDHFCPVGRKLLSWINKQHFKLK